jgi:hypothetical protein
LLVENYQLTALVGLRIGKEFLDNFNHFVIPFSSVRLRFIAKPWRRSLGWRRCCLEIEGYLRVIPWTTVIGISMVFLVRSMSVC